MAYLMKNFVIAIPPDPGPSRTQITAIRPNKSITSSIQILNREKQSTALLYATFAQQRLTLYRLLASYETWYHYTFP